MDSYLPRALIYREWKEQRSWLIGGTVLILGELWLRLLVVALQLASDSGLPPRVAWAGLWSYVSSSVEQLSSEGTTGAVAVLTMMAVATRQVARERAQGDLLGILMGPVKRADLLRVKFVVGCGWILCTLSLLVFLLTILNLTAPKPVSAGQMAAFACDKFSLWMAFYGLAFMVSCVVSGAVPAFLLTALLADVPVWLPGLVALVIPPEMKSATWPDVMAPLSPWTWLSAAVPIPWLIVLWLLFLAWLGYFVGQRAFARMLAEDFDALLGLPALWRLVIPSVSVLLGLVVATATSARTGRWGLVPVVFVVCVALLWAGLDVAQRTLQRGTWQHRR
ncbi:hypothetical protein [Alicyclobacillus shizuokensis]|uniref:hypothetical protein n=1 Tax=Alicyclobacillus shizuokensis TaxID=392014 RepID=UPI00082AB6D7|nr:hypothetical protein [Alicyclobacillus shizuokensis]MCL6626829.1 hypothetical protein [Alicyclobacillus shizuokensis]